MKVAIISTSPRQNSNSLKVAKYLKSLISAHESDTSLVDFREIDIPMVGQGTLDEDNLSDFQEKLITVWGDADLVVMAAPEYNWITSGQLINALHQLGKKPFLHLFNNKVFALVGVSAGRGGRQPCIEVSMIINKLIGFTKQEAIVSPLFFESHETGKNLEEDGTPTGNETYTKGMIEFVDYTLRIAKRWHEVK
ncbi:NAD(P)H-dependent oxidoreductase [Persicitalea sp.]|uniref:NAD(P)H-dependent oxidoreductase n=1 Tax=Persicitalea sp. TaxID=3100273 RepID=UPI0035942CF0